MGSTSRTIIAQMALGAAFGTALAWKTARVRRPGPVRRDDRDGLATPGAAGADAPGPYGATATRDPRASSVGHRAGAAQARDGAVSRTTADGRRGITGRLPETARLAFIAGVALLVPIVVGVTFALTRSSSSGTADAGNAVSTSVPAATSPAVATGTPTLADELLDARRALDLRDALDAADAYATLFGAYPSTGGALTTLCLHPTDAGCAIAKYATNLPVSDGQFAYWYASDGRSVTVLARVQTAPEQDDCPADLPAALIGAPVVCLRGSVGTQ